MKEKLVSWEIVTCGLLLTGMAVMLFLQTVPVQPLNTTSSSMHENIRVIMPNGPSCDVVASPTPPIPPQFPELLGKQIHLKIEKLQKLEKLHKLNIIDDELQAGQRVIVIRPNGDKVVTISG